MRHPSHVTKPGATAESVLPATTGNETMDDLIELLQAIRPADVLDIAFISVLLYAVLTWFRETTSRPVYIGLAVLAVVYLLARAFDMAMTALFFQAVFAVLLMALVVVFQEDLRRVFERISTLGTLRDARLRPTTFSHIDTLVTVATQLAAKRIGALMVLKGREPLERHIDRGIENDGYISKPLLESIFDPHSMGHDGAVVIQGNRVKQFAAHLPLSRNLQEVRSRGTRHSAAVGLSEVCDALVIVVSEERGEISVAEGGKLNLALTPAVLQDRLERFCRQIYPRETKEIWKRLWKEHAALKALSLVLACFGWYLLSYQTGTVQQTFKMPVELRNAPKDLVFDDPLSEVKVTLSGRERSFALLVPGALKVSLDVSEIGEGLHQIPLEDEHVKRPPNLAVYGIEPRTLVLDAHALVPAQLPVEVQTSGRLAEGFELKRLQVSPRSVNAMVWRAERQKTQRLLTAPIDLGRFSKSATVDAALVLPRHVRTVNGAPLEVKVTVEVAKTPEPPAKQGTSEVAQEPDRTLVSEPPD
jgi:diadenylate cyclase